MLPYYVDKYPHIQNAVLPVTQMIQNLPSISESEKMPAGVFELEARLGEWKRDPQTGQFVFKSGVGVDFFQQTIRLFEQFSDWHHITPWAEIVDYFYPLPLPKGGGVSRKIGAGLGSGNSSEMARTSSFVCPNTGETKVVHIQKHTQERCTFRSSGGSSHLRLPDLRVALNYEETLSPSLLPTHIQPSLVRIKSRRQYRYGKRASEPPLWSFDVTQVWTGKTKAEAERNQQRNAGTLYEIEVECLNPIRYMQEAHQDEIYVATSLLLKITRLYDVESDQFALVNVAGGPGGGGGL